MKLSVLRCSACGAEIRTEEANPRTVECEYCHTRYVIEWDPGQLTQSGDGIQPYLMPLPEDTIEPIPPSRPKKKSGWEPWGWKRGVALVLVFFVLLGIMYGPAVLNRWQADHEAAGQVDGQAEETSPSGTNMVLDAPSFSLDGLMEAFAVRVFGKPVEEITDQEFAKIAWLEMKSGMEEYQVGYSFEDPFENPDAQLTWLGFPRDSYSSPDFRSLPLFSGLKKLSTSQSLKAEYLKGLHLKSLHVRAGSLGEAAELLEHPENLRELSLSMENISLQGADLFPALETLSLSGTTLEQTELLASLKQVKHLNLDLYDGEPDVAVLSVMSWLESLSIRSKNLRDLGFVSAMTSLRDLHVEAGSMLTIAPVEACQGLEHFSMKGCNDVKDLSALSSLTGLKSLRAELPYGCPQPELDQLTGMEELYLKGFEDMSFLRKMEGLRTLTLDSCVADDPSDFSELTALKFLRCTSFASVERDYSFITSLPSLEELDLGGAVTYQDISGIFNLPVLRDLNISHMQCEIDFDKIQENTSLKRLSMDGIKLYRNVKVSGGGGITYVDWDDVALTDHLDFLGKLSGLTELSIRENKLTDVGFAPWIPALESIDFSDNYVTDLAPLSGLPALQNVSCAGNPIANYGVLGEDVSITK